MINVFVVEDTQDHQIYLTTIVKSSPIMKFLGLSSNGTEAIQSIRQLKPDIVMMDIGLPDMSGIDCINALKTTCPEVKFMICTIHEEDDNVFQALKAGADSYILKRSKDYQIIDAIQDLYHGDAPISSSIARKILTHLPKQSDDKNKDTEYHITPREAEILHLLSKGKSYKEISEILFISIRTLKWHVFNIYKKLQADNRTEALNRYFGNL